VMCDRGSLLHLQGNWEHSFGVCLWYFRSERHLIETIESGCAYGFGVQKGFIDWFPQQKLSLQDVVNEQ
jgi:hypothetical protein